MDNMMYFNVSDKRMVILVQQSKLPKMRHFIARLSIFIKAIEDLVKITELISVRCNEHLKEIESEDQIVKRKALLQFG